MAAEDKKPTIVISHGAWHGPPHFEPLSKCLRSLGCPVVARRHPSCCDDSDFAENSLYDDARALRLEIERQVDQGKKVIVMGHSYGGMVMSEGVLGEMGLGKIKGRRGGVIGLVYVCAFMTCMGKSVADVMANYPETRQDGPRSEVDERDHSTIHIKSKEVFYNDISESEQEHWSSLVRPMSGRPLRDRLTAASWIHFPSMYVHCTLDGAIPPRCQRAMAEEAKEAGAELVMEVEMEVSHSPFLKDPDTLARHIAEFAKLVEGQSDGKRSRG